MSGYFPSTNFDRSFTLSDLPTLDVFVSFMFGHYGGLGGIVGVQLVWERVCGEEKGAFLLRGVCPFFYALLVCGVGFCETVVPPLCCGLMCTISLWRRCGTRLSLSGSGVGGLVETKRGLLKAVSGPLQLPDCRQGGICLCRDSPVMGSKGRTMRFFCPQCPQVAIMRLAILYKVLRYQCT